MGLSPSVEAVVGAAADLCPEVLAQIPQPAEKGKPPLIRRFAATLLLAAVAGLVIRSLPDVARDLKMREV